VLILSVLLNLNLNIINLNRLTGIK
jgi:hypothetical protein